MCVCSYEFELVESFTLIITLVDIPDSKSISSPSLRAALLAASCMSQMGTSSTTNNDI